MAQSPVINRSVVFGMFSLVDFCYRKGVEHAYRIDDEGLAREFLGKTSQIGVYGFLREDGATMDWKEWSLRLMSQARMTSWNGAMSRYFLLVGGRANQNYLGAFIPVAQVFYNKGVRDYIENPHSADYLLFQGKTRVFWTPKGLKKVNNRRYIDEIQLCCFDLKRRDKIVWEAETATNARRMGALTASQYDSFIRAVGLALIAKN